MRAVGNAAGMLGDWIVPFYYNAGVLGFRSSLLFWVFLGQGRASIKPSLLLEKDAVVTKLVGGVGLLAKARKIQTFTGTATAIDLTMPNLPCHIMKAMMKMADAT